MNVFERMEFYRPEFTKSEERIVSALLENPQMIEYFTISRVADFVGSSRSAILRFCQKLRYSGYSEFRFDLIKTLHTRREGAAEVSLLATYVNIFSTGVEQLAQIPERDILDVVKLIDRAPIIRCMGMLNSSLPALKFYYDFTVLGKNVIPITDTTIPGTIEGLSPGDFVVVFSIKGGVSSKSIGDFLDRAKELGCEILLITCNPKSKAAKYATKLLQIPTLQLSSATNVDEHALMMVLVNILSGYYKIRL